METKKQLREKIIKMENEKEEFRKKMGLYLDSARIEEYKEFKKILDDGEIVWIEYKEIDNETISINDCIYQRDVVIVSGTRVSKRIVYGVENPLYSLGVDQISWLLNYWKV